MRKFVLSRLQNYKQKQEKEESTKTQFFMQIDII